MDKNKTSTDEREAKRRSEALASHTGEFLLCFVMVGFDAEGRMYLVQKEKGEMQRMAITRALENVLSLREVGDMEEPGILG
ncbi:MAG: hypothetical protein WC932_06120 [archaeon]